MPGLVDGHVHPVFGEWTPTQDTIGWIGNYVHGGTTTMISACELHVPGLDYENLTPDLVTSLAVVTAATTGRVRWSGARVHAGTVILVPGMTEAHFDRLAAAKSICAKFIFFPLATHKDEALRYTALVPRPRHPHQGAHRRRVALGAEPDVRLRHSVLAQAGRCRAYQRRADPDERRRPRQGDRRHELRARNLHVRQLRLDQARGRPHAREGPARAAHARHRHAGRHRRGAARRCCATSATSSSVCGVPPAEAVAIATGNTAKAHGLDVGVLAPGRPADIVVCGPVEGSAGTEHRRRHRATATCPASPMSSPTARSWSAAAAARRRRPSASCSSPAATRTAARSRRRSTTSPSSLPGRGAACASGFRARASARALE